MGVFRSDSVFLLVSSVWEFLRNFRKLAYDVVGMGGLFARFCDLGLLSGDTFKGFVSAEGGF